MNVNFFSPLLEAYASTGSSFPVMGEMTLNALRYIVSNGDGLIRQDVHEFLSATTESDGRTWLRITPTSIYVVGVE